MKIEPLKQRLSQLLQKLKGDKKTLCILAAGVLLMAVVFAFDTSGQKETRKEKNEEGAVQTLSAEEQLCDLLSNIKGAGKVKVMITYAAGARTVYAVNREETGEERETGTSSRRTREDYVVTKDSDGEGGLVLQEIPPQVCGVAVVCGGGSDPVLKAQIVEAVRALFNIKSTNISVAELAAEGGA